MCSFSTLTEGEVGTEKKGCDTSLETIELNNVLNNSVYNM